MSDSTPELGEIRKRLEELEKQLRELRAGQLAIMKMMAAEICEIYYNISLLSQKGEGVLKYIELWSRRLDDVRRIIQATQTIEDATKTSDKFLKELADYGREQKAASPPQAGASPPQVVKEVDSAEEAMDIANAFMKKDHPVALPLKVVRRDDVWLVDVDIGAVRMEIVRVKIDAKTGAILGHETIEKK